MEVHAETVVPSASTREQIHEVVPRLPRKLFRNEGRSRTHRIGITSGSDCAHRCTLFSCDACMPRFCALQRRSALYAVDGAFSTRAFPLLSVAQRRQKIAPYVSAGKADHTTASPFRTARTPRPLTLDKRHAVRRDTLYSPPTLNRNPARKLIPSAGYPTTSSYCLSSAFCTLTYAVTRGWIAYHPPKSTRAYPGE